MALFTASLTSKLPIIIAIRCIFDRVIRGELDTALFALHHLMKHRPKKLNKQYGLAYFSVRIKMGAT